MAGARCFAAGFAPGSRGNYMTAMVLPGRDLPPDPVVAEVKPGDEP